MVLLLHLGRNAQGVLFIFGGTKIGLKSDLPYTMPMPNAIMERGDR